jgi:fluoroquinolone resistance protein
MPSLFLALIELLILLLQSDVASCRSKALEGKLTMQDSHDLLIQDRHLTVHAIQELIGVRRHLVACDLEALNGAELDLSQWTFERCSFRRANLRRANLEGTRWVGCRAAFATFEGSRLEDAVFISSDLNNASFDRCALEGARFDGCKLTGAVLTGTSGINVHFEESLLSSAKLPGRSFRKKVLRRLDFSQSDLSKCDFRQATFQECSLRDADLEGARFDKADLRGADLGGIRLKDASRFRGAIISQSQAGQLLEELGLTVS